MTQFDQSIHQQQPLSPTRPLENSTKVRGTRVKDLIRERRKIALIYQRSQSDSDRHQLDNIDRALADYAIDIPAIQRTMSHSKMPKTVTNRQQP